MATFQYQALSEPVVSSAPPPTVLLDWWQPISQPTRRRRSLVPTTLTQPLPQTAVVAIAKYVATHVQIEGTTYVYLQPLHNLQSAVAPGVDDDASIGYAPGSIWIDKTLDNAYICVGAVPGSAVWKQID